MTYQLFSLPKAQAFASGRVAPGAKLSFYLTGTSTPTPVYTTSALSVAHTQPVEADSAGVFPAIFLDPTITYKATLTDSADVLQYTVDPVNDLILSQVVIGAYLYPRTAAEISAGVTPTYYYYQPGDVRRYGAVGDGATDDTAAIQKAIDVLLSVTFPDGDFLAHGLTQSQDNQRFYGTGETRIIKNANGTLFSSTGDNVELDGISFRGDAASPVYTGDNFVATGNHVRLINCGSRWCPGRPVKITGNHAQIIGTCDIYQTTDSSSTGYDIELGISGTATLYHSVADIYTSQATGGILTVDTGSAKIIGSQFGKLTVSAGTLPSGVNGGNFAGNRINGNVKVSVSNSTFVGNAIAGSSITFDSGTSGHSFDRSNLIQSGTTLTNSSNASVIEDARDVPFQSYTLSWTAATVNPDIGNGTITATFSKKGREVTVAFKIVMGSTTTFGTGAYSFSLPFVPNTGLYCIGNVLILDSGTNFRTGVVRTLTSGSAVCQIYYDTAVAGIGPTTPFTWASGDQIMATVTYYTD